MAQKKYLDYDGLVEFKAKLEQKYGTVIQFKGTVQNIAALDLAHAKAGYAYNIVEAGTTTSDFVEGAGKELRAGSNVAAINVAAEGSPEVLKWDILAGFFSVDDKLTFGGSMPANPVDGDTFLYLGETTYEYNEVTPAGTENPHDLGWYESDGQGGYALSSDTTVDVAKTYYTKDEQYVTGVIYVYDGTAGEWEAQTAGDTMVAITNAEIDALFA